MSDTPRTDGYVKTLIDNNRGAESLEHFSRQLERELNAANERIAELQSELDGFKEWNWKLREVGEDMHYRLTLHASHEPILKKWKEIRNGLNQ